MNPNPKSRPARRLTAAAGLVLGALALVFAGAGRPATVHADDPKARAIMVKVNNRDDGDNNTNDMEMTLIDSRNSRRVRRLTSYRKHKGPDTVSLMFFLEPADVEGTGFLTYDYEAQGKDDDQWLFLPALRKSKRIASDDKSGAFMGSDFNFSDMTDPDLSKYDFSLVKEEAVNGTRTWVIDTVPRDEATAEETGYAKGRVWVRQDNYVVIRGIRWVYRSRRLKFMQVNRLEKFDGVWVPTEMQMVTREGNKTVHATLLKMANVKFNQKLDDSLFTLRRLEKGL